MKRYVTRILVALTLCLNFSALLAQTAPGTLDLTLVIKDRKGRGMANVEVEFVEIQTRQRIVATAGKDGVLKQHFDTGRYWQINIKDIRNYFFWQIEVPPGRKYRMSKSLTYNYDNYERESRPNVDRSRLRLKTVPLKTKLSDRPSETEGIVRLEIQRGDKSPLGRFPVALTCYKLNTTYTAQTNPGGIAVFKVPLGQEYEVDLDGIESFQYCDLVDKPYYMARKRFTYEPTEIVEKTKGDTVTQKLKPGQKGTSGRVITTVTMRRSKDQIWPNEPVFLQVVGKNKWYKGYTNQRGEVQFLLPKGEVYMVHGRFEPDLDVMDYRRRRGIGYGHKRVLYRPMNKYQFPDTYIPTTEQLIVQAFQNYLEKKYPLPEGDDAVRMDATFTAPVNADSKEAVLRLAFAANPGQHESYAPPLNVAFVIDKSGSMYGHDRMDQLKKSLLHLVQKLRPDDMVSLVIFEDFETVVIPASKLGDRELFKDVIVRLEANGGTNIFKGMLAGYKEVQKNYKPGRTNRLILLSDGFGVTPIDEIIAGQKVYSDKGIECSTVGVGENYNYALLAKLATNGGGHMEHVGDAKGMQAAFTRQLTSMLFPVASDVEVEVIFNKHLRYQHLYGYPLKARGNNRLSLRLNNIYAGLDQLAFVRFSLENANKELLAEPVTVRIRYKDLRTGERITEEKQVVLEWSEDAGALPLVLEQQEKKLYAVAVMNQSLKVMSDKFHKGDVPAAKKALEDGLATLSAQFPGPMDGDLAELRTQLLGYLDVIEKQ